MKCEMLVDGSDGHDSDADSESESWLLVLYLLPSAYLPLWAVRVSRREPPDS